MSDDASSAGGVPEWVVTFGDMMSLLLTFFIMLVSFSELKSEEKYQALLDAFQQQFGYNRSKVNVLPGELRPRNSVLAKLASLGRAKRLDLMQGGAKVQSPAGDHSLVQMVRPGKQTGLGTVLYFDEEQIELNDAQRKLLLDQAQVIQGKPQKVEIRGHTSNRPLRDGSVMRDSWDVAYERSRQVMAFLTGEAKIDPRRVRIAAAAANEPQHLGTDPAKLRLNPRVEIYLLEEVIGETTGTDEEREARFTKGLPTGRQ